MTNSFFGRERSRQVRPVSFSPVIFLAPPLAICGAAMADPTLPTIGSTVYNVTVSNSSIDGGATVSTGALAASNAAVINAFISYASSNGGGTVELPAAASPYLSNQLTLASGVNLQVDTGATLQNGSPTTTFINATASGLHDIEISGGGIIDNHANSTSSNNMITLQNINNLEVTNVTIENSSHYHLVPAADNNVTINHVTIQDPMGYLANTDGIDYSGNHYLIENCTLNDGDDDIVAKPGIACSDITITSCTIGAGHGISIGSGTTGGLNGMTVTNCTFNGTANGFRLKAGRGGGGTAQNVTYSNCTMTNVINPLFISSWYVNGADHYPSPGPANATNGTVNSTTPYFHNITFSNITSTDTVDSTANLGLFYGIPEAPIQGLTLKNVSLTATVPMVMNYAGYNGVFSSTPDPNYEVLLQNVTLNGSPANLSNSSQFTQYPNGLYDAVVVVAVPEPAGGMLALGALAGLSLRRSRSRRSQAGPPPPT